MSLRPRQAAVRAIGSRAPRQPISAHMTPSPHSIGKDQTLERAHAAMRALGVRHLPVLHAGKLLGVVTQRDLYFLEALGDVDAGQVKVEEAMSQDVYTVPPDAELDAVARTMAEHKYGCAVVVDRDHVVGVFTTVDALRVLSELARPESRR